MPRPSLLAVVLEPSAGFNVSILISLPSLRLFDLYEVSDERKLSLKRRVVRKDLKLIYFVKSECLANRFLLGKARDRAFYESYFYFNFCHFKVPP